MCGYMRCLVGRLRQNETCLGFLVVLLGVGGVLLRSQLAGYRTYGYIGPTSFAVRPKVYDPGPPKKTLLARGAVTHAPNKPTKPGHRNKMQ